MGRGSTPSGSEDPSWPPSPPSSRCGFPSRSTTSAAPPSSTASASKLSCYVIFLLCPGTRPDRIIPSASVQCNNYIFIFQIYLNAIDLYFKETLLQIVFVNGCKCTSSG